jgi:hypothetical protein
MSEAPTVQNWLQGPLNVSTPLLQNKRYSSEIAFNALQKELRELSLTVL